MKFLFASDSLKGTISSEKTVELLTRAAQEVFENCECIGVPIADGGEGTTDAVVKATEGEKIEVLVHGPLMRLEKSYYGKLDAERVIVEMAAASGLPMVELEARNPLKTTSFGTGELLKAAIEAGFKSITIAIGGSATNDGGMGCMRALGMRFLDAQGNELEGKGEDLIKVRKIDTSQMDQRIKDIDFTVMCDVNNPLCGENGATYTFGRQKGGTPQILDELEAGMRNYRNVIIQEYGIDPDKIPGAGAAGGIGAAFSVFQKANLKSGIEAILDLIHFDRLLEGVSLVVTGEGCTDWQSCFGKVVQGVGKRCQKYKVPAVALVGSMGQGATDIFKYGIASIVTTVNAVMSLEEALENAEILYYEGALRLFRLLKAGVDIKISEG